MTACFQTCRGFAVEGGALALEERTFVPVDAEPAETVEDGLDRFRGRPRPVGVLDAEDERALVVARIEVAEERRPCAADVQKARGAGREARPDSHGAWLCAGRTQRVKLSTAVRAHL